MPVCTLTQQRHKQELPCPQVYVWRNELHTAFERKSQYETLLQHLAEFLDTADRKLEEERLEAVNLPDLRQQLHAHKVGDWLYWLSCDSDCKYHHVDKQCW